MRRSLFALVAVLTFAVPPAFAGIVDSPLPVLVAGENTFHLYSVPGIMEFGDLSTFFSCTSTDTATIEVGVEIFGFLGGAPANDAAATSIGVAPGGTVVLGMAAAVGISISTNLNVGPVSRGSARILATSKKLICTAFVADVGNNPPTSMAQLTIVAKTKQKAAN